MTDALYPPPQWQGVKWLPERRVRWSFLISSVTAFLTLSLIFAGIALVVFKLDEWGERSRRHSDAPSAYAGRVL